MLPLVSLSSLFREFSGSLIFVERFANVAQLFLSLSTGLLLVCSSFSNPPVCQIHQPFEPFLNLLKIVRSAPLSHLLLVKSSSPFDFSNSIVSLDWFAPLSKLSLQLLVTSLVSLELCSSLSVSLIFFMHPCSCFSGSSLSSGLRASRS